MSSQEIVEVAEGLATRSHAGQFRRGGVIPYIEHPRAVAMRLAGDPDAQAVAWLHDVLEDTDTTHQDLLDAGIPSPLADAVLLLTKTEGISYEEYLDRIDGSPLARKVKIADMLSNLADSPTNKQIQKYAHGLLRLTRNSS